MGTRVPAELVVPVMTVPLEEEQPDLLLSLGFKQEPEVYNGDNLKIFKEGN